MTGNSTQGCQLKSRTFSKTRDQIARCLDNRWSKVVQKHLKNCQKFLCKNVNFKKTQSIPGANKWLSYVLYIRSMLEQWAVVWYSLLTLGEEKKLERVLKVALRLILGDDYKD